MTKDQILEGNKLIARFMGYEYYPHSPTERLAGWRKGNGHLKLGGSYLCRHHKSLPFRNNWNHLMLVCKKIHEAFRGTVKEGSFRLQGKVLEGCQECDIEKTFTAAVDSIKWIEKNI